MEDIRKSKNAHVLILPYPGQGHINPMLQFSKRLVFKGIRPTLASTVYLSKSMHATFGSTSFASYIKIRTISDGFDIGGRAESKSPRHYLDNLQAHGSRTLTELVKTLAQEGDPLKAIIYDAYFPWALDVAKEFGLVAVPFFTQSCAVSSVYYHLQRGLIKLPIPGPEPRTVSVPGVPELQLREAPSFVLNLGISPWWFEVLVGQFSNLDQADFVLFNIFYEMENEVVDWMAKFWQARTIGPTIPSYYLDKRLEDDKDYTLHLFKPNTTLCKNWLDSKPKQSIIYVCFGSTSEPSQEQYEEVANALKATRYNFLWLVRESEQRRLPKGYVEEVTSSGMGLIVDWASQLEVLAHEAIGCFITHCGFNSTLEVLSLGVPVVAVPIWADQWTNAKYLEDVWGVGVRAKADEKGIVRKDRVVECLKEVMEGDKREAIMKNVVKWKRLAKEAVDEGGSSDKNIDELVACLMA